MSKLLKGVITTFMLVAFTGCVSTSDIEVETAKSEKANLEGYKTYQLIDESGFVKDPKTKESSSKLDIDIELQEMINDELASKGKMPTANNPDFYVAYVGGTDMNHLVKKLDKDGKETIAKVPTAAIVLLLIDANTGEIIWIATAEGEAKGLPEEETKKRLHYAIKKMLKDL